MTPRKTPYRSGYKRELAYPNNKGGVLLPSHGNGPRCMVDYDQNDDGPWTTLQIMRIDSDVVEHYPCAIPRYYAIPLILINKQLAFYEAQCHPDGTPLPRSSSCGIKQRELREYSYLWNLRGRFLQAIFDMNHERLLNERWRHDGIHGFLHRMYRRFGHDRCQRLAYWRGENKEGRVPYTAPDIAEMDWKAYIHEDMTTSTRINGFLWVRVSQGYSRVIEDKPPFESWRAWRAGHRDHKPVPHLTPASSPVPELPNELDGVSAAAVAVAERATQGSCSNCGACAGYDTGVRSVTAPPTPAAASTNSSSSTQTSCSGSATRSRRGVGVVAGVTGNEDGDETVPTAAALTGPPNSQEWALSLPSLSQGSSQSSEGSTSRSTNTSTSSQGRFRQRQISFRHNAPEDMELAVIKCIYTRMEDGVKVKNFEPEVEVAYVENLSQDVACKNVPSRLMRQI